MLVMWTRIFGYGRIASLVCEQASFKNKIIHLVKKILFVEPKFITTFTLPCASLIQPIPFRATSPI